MIDLAQDLSIPKIDRIKGCEKLKLIQIHNVLNLIGHTMSLLGIM